MTSPVSVCNRALGEAGVRAQISDFDQVTQAAVQCKLNYGPLRRQLLRTAQWGFARKTVMLSPLGLATDVPNLVPYPWLVKYTYPPDCEKVRYLLPPPPDMPAGAPAGSIPFSPWAMPSRQWRFLPALDDVNTPPRKVILSNLLNAICVYTADVEACDLWDPLFDNAMVNALANKLVMPLSGNVQMKGTLAQQAEFSILQARAADGNEAIPKQEHIPDWIAARGVGSTFGYNPAATFGNLGYWYGGNEDMAWSS